MGRNPQDNRLSMKAYEWIRDEILANRLHEGEPLSENRLAQELAISRTPIREALRNLEQDGFVKSVPGKGAFVAEVSREDVVEIYELRLLLEPLAARTAVGRVPEEAIDALEADWRDLRDRAARGEAVEYEEVHLLDRRSHGLLNEHSSNRKLRQILSLLHSQIERFQFLSARSLADVRDTAAQHLEICAVLRRRDPEALARLLEEHIRRSEDYILSRYLRR
ncbi:transcriptional regulator, GntR family [Aminomonas paucivorans DSM 12260]|uniref:Transcriptional regulator, GntR family n=1 Tax=Aminomonas paucivorans DSM 12260 TaxID=584708 RepID=E3CXQ4_9BACT|nr:GntR family transcriptional regulator [Aminomonas paucivorans]EFQ22647.1 transcriptional regulator, GntR family [Aminomonas paucivorans DSM 12260]